MDNEECLSVIQQNVHLINLDDLMLITDFLRDSVGSELSYLPQLVDIMALALASDRNTAQNVCDFLEAAEPFQKFLDYDLSTEKYFESLTEFLNKQVDGINIDKLSSVAPFLTALMISPTRTIEQVQNYAIADSNLVLNGMKLLLCVQSFVFNYMDDSVSNLLVHRIGEADQLKGLFDYVALVFNHGLINQNEFVKNVLFAELMEKSTTNGNDTLALLKICDMCHLGSDMASNHVAPFIVGLGQVADEYRWDLLGYTELKERIVTLATKIIGKIANDRQLEGKCE